MRNPSTDHELTSIWTPANVVTCARIVMIPFFMVFALGAGSIANISSAAQSVIAFVLYVALSATDRIDGQLARSRDEITDFGKFLDPIADKLLVFSALLIFIEHGELAAWVVFIILLRELLVSALRMVASADGIVLAADVLGKWKTAITMVSICLYLLADMLAACSFGGASIVTTVAASLMAIAVVLTVASGVQYFWQCRSVVFRV